MENIYDKIKISSPNYKYSKQLSKCSENAHTVIVKREVPGIYRQLIDISDIQ